MSYTNQPEHPLLDRRRVVDVLRALTRATVSTSPTALTREQQVDRLMRLAASDLERKWLGTLQQHSLRLPDEAGKLYPQASTRPDFVYAHEAVVDLRRWPAHATPNARPVTPPSRPPWRTLASSSCASEKKRTGWNSSGGIRRYSDRELASMSFAVGSLVRARGREWVVLPESEADLVVVRPLGGTDDEVTGILAVVENRSNPRRCRRRIRITPATIDRLDCSETPSAWRSATARVRFDPLAGSRVDPRPYQLVPLLMALRLDPVRMLIADDVGIGKTVEACLIARELLDRGEVQRMAVLCPPHLAEQWQREMQQKFNLEAELVLPSTARRLEAGLPRERVAVRRVPVRDRVDRLHQVATGAAKISCVPAPNWSSWTKRIRARRVPTEARLVISGINCSKGSRRRPNRHLILVTATPHSGKQDAFRSLLTLLDPELRQFARRPGRTGQRTASSQACRPPGATTARRHRPLP